MVSGSSISASAGISARRVAAIRRRRGPTARGRVACLLAADVGQEVVQCARGDDVSRGHRETLSTKPGQAGAFAAGNGLLQDQPAVEADDVPGQARTTPPVQDNDDGLADADSLVREDYGDKTESNKIGPAASHELATPRGPRNRYSLTELPTLARVEIRESGPTWI